MLLSTSDSLKTNFVACVLTHQTKLAQTIQPIRLKSHDSVTGFHFKDEDAMRTKSPSRYIPLLLLLIGFATLIGTLPVPDGLPFASRPTQKPFPTIDRLLPERSPGTHFYTDTLPERARETGSTIEQWEEIKGRTPADKAAWENLDRGCQMWRSGNRFAAVTQWRQIVTTQPGTEVAFDAQFNIAEAARYWGNYPATVRELTKIIDTPLSISMIKKNSEWHLNFNKHIACQKLSDFCLDDGDLPAALKYADLALKYYPGSGFCGICNQMERRHMQDHIARLKAEITNSSLTISSN